jgi:hypothetical protein
MKTKTSILALTKSFFILLVSCCLFSCGNEKKLNEYEQLLSGKHELRKFNVKTTNKTESSGCWFFVVGSYSSKTTEESKIRFYFMTIKGEYVFKEMDFNKVNVKIDSTAKIPYVKFYWKNYGSTYSGNAIYEHSITRAVIYCKEEDFQPEININELR